MTRPTEAPALPTEAQCPHLWATARHEAGHVVVARHLGSEADTPKLTQQAPAVYGATTYVRTPMVPGWERDRIAINAAGGYAAGTAFGTGMDRDATWEVMDRLPEGKREAVAQEGVALGRWLVERHREEIEAVARTVVAEHVAEHGVPTEGVHLVKVAPLDVISQWPQAWLPLTDPDATPKYLNTDEAPVEPAKGAAVGGPVTGSAGAGLPTSSPATPPGGGDMSNIGEVRSGLALAADHASESLGALQLAHASLEQSQGALLRVAEGSVQADVGEASGLLTRAIAATLEAQQAAAAAVQASEGIAARL
jgi:hypothetical protein